MPNRKVISIGLKRAEAIICQYHYSMSLPGTSYAYGLTKPPNKKLEGVCCFGIGSVRNLQKNIEKKGWEYLELTRLVLIHNEKNDASYLIGNALQQLPTPCLVVSYADEGWDHVGKVYQATNWIYSGVSGSDYSFLIDGQIKHRKSIYSKYGTQSIPEIKKKIPEAEVIESGEKHRYFYPLGSKSERKEMKKWIDKNFGIQPYPKGDSKNYNIKKVRQQKNQNKPEGLF